MTKIITVANRLPITLGKTIKKSSGGLVSALDGVKNLSWVGWPGLHVNDKAEQKKFKTLLQKDFNSHPVFLTPKEISDYYHGFANACLWPALHYFPQYIHYHQNWWDSYQKVNQKFADTLIPIIQPQDTIWIHDYHLMLLPEMLRKKFPNIKIGFFLHTPFPSYEVFRCIPHREEILNGILGADLIGFHTYGYLRHFRSSINRILHIETDMDKVISGPHFSQMGVFPIGINAPAFLKEQQTKRFKKRLTQLKKTYEDKKIVLSVERLDYTKGIVRRLEAIEKFLSSSNNKQNTIFIFISIPSRGEVKEYSELKESVEHMIGRINGKLSRIDYTPIHFIHSSISFTDLCALYAIADVAMVTPLIDGMNLVAKEYIACQPNHNAGVLLLSEFTGAAQELFDALIINPYDSDDIASHLKIALEMPLADRQQKVQAMYSRVMSYDAKRWAELFIETLKSTQNNPSEKTYTADQPSPINIIKNLGPKQNIALFIDYDGTLREFENQAHLATPTPEILKILKNISSIKNISPFLISGRKAHDLEKWFCDINIPLIAEHGYRYRSDKNTPWVHLMEDSNLHWKESVLEMFHQFTETTPGSCIEEKVSSIVWHYRKSDPEFGTWKAEQLVDHLKGLLVNQAAVVQHGKKIVEVSSLHVNKGEAVLSLIKNKKFDTIICAGDDRTDEHMFRIEDPRLISIKVGQGDTFAKYRLPSPTKFRSFLKEFYQ